MILARTPSLSYQQGVRHRAQNRTGCRLGRAPRNTRSRGAYVPQPLTSSLNFVGGEPGVPNLVMSKLGGSGNVGIFNFSPGGTTDAIVDVVGWYAKT